MGVLHAYTVDVRWTGAGQTGTTGYTAYSRDHEVRVEGRPVLLGSADPAFRGDPSRHTPEELFVAALSQCHLLWFLHLAAVEGVVVVDYRDEATGTMRVESAGAGQFTEVTLHPRVTVRGDVDETRVAAVHQRAHEHCFIARSVNFPVRHEPVVHREA
ncbi:OsmC family protein [uncultured Cellulomonas sp.]|uniref:OsmC family protein n=1 Tax=uncultured Cellulomonas sp. TaxID=189682 RepID=UPI0026281E8D|nr:OsmC family protein [uncultured Cellulomonas sp.]